MLFFSNFLIPKIIPLLNLKTDSATGKIILPLDPIKCSITELSTLSIRKHADQSQIESPYVRGGHCVGVEY